MPVIHAPPHRSNPARTSPECGFLEEVGEAGVEHRYYDCYCYSCCDYYFYYCDHCYYDNYVCYYSSLLLLLLLPITTTYYYCYYY